MGVQQRAWHVMCSFVLLVVGAPGWLCYVWLHLLWKFSGPFLPIGVCDPWLLQSYNFDLQYRLQFWS